MKITLKKSTSEQENMQGTAHPLTSRPPVNDCIFPTVINETAKKNTQTILLSLHICTWQATSHYSHEGQ
ncbi:hypothetical protein Y032_0225g2757 [Ancylostoma ceylanicum]|uniref:Uncharacterized protein n=1 Tax=Ancylostoma ceylanicum TaxID=53326 RepID=A0A016SH69_9BILA|nr:hypothetical protein Y032_0225g2757 [Ancylostoma ceylanicum]